MVKILTDIHRYDFGICEMLTDCFVNEPFKRFTISHSVYPGATRLNVAVRINLAFAEIIVKERNE